MSVAVACLGWLLVTAVPGVAVTAALWPGAGAGRTTVVAPPIGIGVTMVVGQVLQLSDASVRPATVLPFSLGLPLALLVASRARRIAPTGVRGMSRDTGVVCAAVLVGLAVWSAALAGRPALLPNIDGANHGLFVARIMRLATIDPHVVAAGDLATLTPHPSYYPLGLHLSAALVSRITGASVSTVLTTAVVLSAAIVLPIGTYLLARRLTSGPTAAVAALLATTFPWFPYSPMIWGGVPLLIAMTQVPGLVDAAWADDPARIRCRHGVVLAFAAYGLFEEHNSELATALVIIAVMAVAALRRHGRSAARQLLAPYGAAAALFLLLVLPDAHQVLAGASERSANLGNKLVSGNPVLLFLGAANPLVLLLALVGVVVAVRARTALPWLAGTVLVGAIYAASFLPPTLSHALTFPWYASSARVSYALSYFEVVFGAIGAVAIARRAGRVGDALGGRVAVVRVGGAVGVLAFGLLTVLPSFAAARFAFRDESPVSGPQRSAFAWLADHVRPGDRVLNDFVDGSGWMETLDRVTPVFATYPNPEPGIAPQVAWGDRWYLFTHAACLATDRRAQAAALHWRVAYAYVGGTTIHPFDARLTVAALSASPAYELVWRSGPAAVFRIVLPAGHAGPTAAQRPAERTTPRSARHVSLNARICRGAVHGDQGARSRDDCQR